MAELDESAALVELERLARSDETVSLELNAFTAWVVMAQLQLALRHPANAGNASADIAAAVARQIQSMLAPPGSILEATAEAGWDPTQDEPFDD